LPREFLHDATFRARFEREARTIAALEHPGIVPVYDYGEEDGQPYIVMRLMKGGSLADKLRTGPLDLPTSARIIHTLALALNKANFAGVIHRDLKPSNILFDADDNPYLSDFGIAKLVESSTVMTGTAAVGTPAYMSPEQARGEKDVDSYTDIYALGVIVFQMLTGRLPYEADTPMGMAVKHMTDPIPRARAFRPSLPAQIEPMMQKAMAKRRTGRYQTADQLAAELSKLATAEHQKHPTSREPSRTAGTNWIVWSTWLKSKPRSLMLVGGLVIVLVGGVSLCAIAGLLTSLGSVQLATASATMMNTKVVSLVADTPAPKITAIALLAVSETASATSTWTATATMTASPTLLHTPTKPTVTADPSGTRRPISTNTPDRRVFNRLYPK
jgi:serine/threonine protein kinase